MNKTSSPRFAFTPLRFTVAVVILFVLYIAFLSWEAGTSSMSTSRLQTSVAHDREYSSAKGMALGAPAMEEEAYAQDSSIAPVLPVYGGDAPAGEAKIIRNGSLAMVVLDIDKTAVAIHDIRTRLKGQPGNANFNEYGKGVRAGTVTLWVPSEKFDEAMAEIKKLALQVTSEQVSVSDVSAQFVDLEARLKNLRATEAQYVEIMTRSGTIEEVVSVMRELSSVRSQIEQIEGQLKYLSRQVALSSITVSLIEEVSPGAVSDEWRPTSVIKAALSGTLDDLTRFVDTLLVLLVKFPLFLLQLAFWLLVLWVLYRLGRFVLEKAGIKMPGQ